MPGGAQLDRHAAGGLNRRVKCNMPKIRRHLDCIGLGEQGKCRSMLREAALVRVLCFLFLEVPGVGHDDGSQRCSLGRGQDRSREAVSHENGEHAGVIQVSMSEDDRVD